MFLSNFSVKKPVATIVIIISLMCLGLLALKKLRVNQNPDVEMPLLVVSMVYPGASPETTEREIINRVEKSLQSISGVNEVRATANEGNATLVLFFNFDKNMIEAADEVRNAIGSIRHKLPIEMREPILQRRDPAAASLLSSSRMAKSRNSRIRRGDRYWPTKLSSLKLRIAWSSVGSQSLPAMSGNHSRSSTVGCSQMRLMSVYMANPSAYGLMPL